MASRWQPFVVCWDTIVIGCIVPKCVWAGITLELAWVDIVVHALRGNDSPMALSNPFNSSRSVVVCVWQLPFGNVCVCVGLGCFALLQLHPLGTAFVSMVDGAHPVWHGKELPSCESIHSGSVHGLTAEWMHVPVTTSTPPMCTCEVHVHRCTCSHSPPPPQKL